MCANNLPKTSRKCLLPKTILQSSAENSGVRKYHAPKNWKYFTMNDLNKPHGSWKKAYDAQQKRYNTLLAGSTLFCFGSAYIVNQSEYVQWGTGPEFSGPMDIPTNAEIQLILDKRRADALEQATETEEVAAEEVAAEAEEVAAEPVEATPEPVEATPEPVEAAPEPVVEAVPEQVEATPEPVVEATPEPVVEATPEPVVEAAPEPVVEAAPEAVEATPEPVVEAVPEQVEATPEPAAIPEVEKTIEEKYPSKLLPDGQLVPGHVPYLIVGAGTASVSAFRAIKAGDARAKVLLISAEGEEPYMRPPLSKELWFSDVQDPAQTLKFKQWNGKSRSVYFEHSQYYTPTTELLSRENGGISVLKNSRVVKIDATLKIAFLDNGCQIRYDKCLLTTGGHPKNLPVLEHAGPSVLEHTTRFRGVADFRRLYEVVEAGKHITIVGGGFLGSELATAIGNRVETTGGSVTQVFPESGNMGKVLPEYLCAWTTQKVRNEGVDVKTNCYVKKAEKTEEGKLKLGLSDGSEILTDHVVVAVGLAPNTELAETSGLELDDKTGGFRVNAELLARTDLWVAGDAASFYDMRLGRRRVEHHDHAIVSGRLAGENMLGRGKPYWHQSMFWSDLGPEVGYEAIGLVDSSLPTVGVFAKATEKDTPKAVVTATGESMRSVTETEATSGAVAALEGLAHAPVEGEQYGKGVVFYLREKKIVGVLLWNVFNKMPIARKVIKENKSYEDFSEVAKLFQLNSDSD